MIYELLRVIHLSDIHFGLETPGQRLAYKDIRQQLIADVRTHAQACGQAHAIFIAGDIAQGGRKDQYDIAATWIEELREAGGVSSKKNVCLVPGNHDVNRGKATPYTRRWQKNIRDNPHDAHEMLGELADEWEVNHPLLRTQHEFWRFAEEYECGFESNISPLWKKKFDFNCGISLKLFGLNTAQVCNESDREALVVLGDGQFNYLTPEDNVILLAMMHHPINWLMDHTPASNALYSRVRVLITGHEHKEIVETINRPSTGKVLCIASGAASPPKGAEFAYNWLEFVCSFDEEDNAILTVKITPKLWSETNKRFEPAPSLLGGQESFAESIQCFKRRKETEQNTSVKSEIDSPNEHNNAHTVVDEILNESLVNDRQAHKTYSGGESAIETTQLSSDGSGYKQASVETKESGFDMKKSNPAAHFERPAAGGPRTPVALSDQRYIDVCNAYAALTDNDRIQVLVSAGLTKPEQSYLLTFTDERTALKRARLFCRLRELWNTISQLDKSLAVNPFTEGE